MPDPSGLYPQPPQPSAGQQNLLNNPLGLAGAMQQIQGFRARQAVGQEFQNSINPDGSFDQAGFAARVKSNPTATLAAPEAYGTLLEQRGKIIDNSKSSLALAGTQNSMVQDVLASIWQDPNMTPDKAASQLIGMATRLGPQNMPSAVVSSAISDMYSSKNPRDWANGLLNIQRGAATAGQVLQGQGPIDPLTGAPTTTTPAGATAAMTAGRGGIAGAGGGYGYPSALPPAAPEVIKANSAELMSDQQAAATRMNAVRNLVPAIQLANEIGPKEFNKGSDEYAKLRSLMQFAGVPEDPKLDARQELNKYMSKYAALVPGAGRSDQAQSLSIESNPNIQLTQGATLNLLKREMAFARMDAALPISFAKSHPDYATNPMSSVGYLNAKANYAPSHDPDAFMHDLMTPEDRDAKKAQLGGKGTPAYQKYKNSYNFGLRSGLIPAAGGQ